uniref:Uncharacterized protein n=1 Tax=Arundo donax TaxID=35708 RepID=A0A0A9FVP0_ARUDO
MRNLVMQVICATEICVYPCFVISNIR